MRRLLKLLPYALALCAAGVVTAPAAEVPTAAVNSVGESGRSPRNASYRIEVTLDPVTRTLTGKQHLTWRNIQELSTEELRFHLYWNGWRNNKSTWMREDRYRGRSDRGSDIAEADWSYLEIDSIILAGAAPVDLGEGARFIAPDDGNVDDRTVLQVPLPQPVEPGETVEIELAWRAKVPRTFARTGFRGDFYFLAHWFPKLGVLEPEGWNCHQFHSATEFYSDYGSYDVEMTVPSGWVLGASGREAQRRENDDGTVTHKYLADDVHAFTWTTSPDYEVHERRFEAAGLPGVDMRLLLQPEHGEQADRHFDATVAALENYGRWFGAYPYDHVTIVDPAFGSGAGGMEYPTLFTAGTRLFNPFGGGSPEGVTIHEAGHQFWYGLVGNNEFEYAWIDEGLNTFSTARVYDEVYRDKYFMKRYLAPPGTDQRGFLPVLFREFPLDRAVGGNRLDRYRRDAVSDVQATPTYLYHPATASSISYSKTALWLHTLERHLGWETLQSILSTFFERWRFGHPTAEDFFAVASEVAGEDLGWFFDQMVNEAHRFDYSVASVKSFEIEDEGLFGSDVPVYRGGQDASGDEDTDASGDRYRSEVVVRRIGSGVFPVDVLLVFEDGSQRRSSWDGAARWKRFGEEGTSRLDYAVVDPERVLLLDVNYTNNSRKMKAAGRLPAAKWGSRWLLWMQDLLAAYAALV